MAYLQPKRTNGEGDIPVFQKVLETARGGFSLDASELTKGEILKRGTPMIFDEATRVAAVAEIDPENGSNANGLLYDDVYIEEGAPVAVVVRGTVYLNRIKDLLGDDEDDYTAHIEAIGPLIIFSNSF